MRNRTLIGLSPEQPHRPRRVFPGTPVHIPPPRRVHRRPMPLTPRGEQLVACLVICYLIVFLTVATVWLQ